MNRVRRPLALAACVFLAAVFFALLITDGSYEMTVPSEEGHLLTGVLVRKEWKTSFSGQTIPVYYVKEDAVRGQQVKCELSYPPAAEPMIGARVSLRGRVSAFEPPTNPGGFDSRRYHAVMKIAYQLKDASLLSYEVSGSRYREALYRLRVCCAALFDAALKEEESAVMKAVILGDKSAMDAELKTLYAASGILHILAVSGLHVSFLGGLLYGFLLRFIPVRMRRLRLLAAGITVFVMVSYGLFTGLSASAFRAVVMFVMKVIADRAGRTYDIPTALSVAAVLLVMEQPLYLLYSGFQFSFLAVLAISVVYPRLLGDTDPLERILMRESRIKRWAEGIRQAFYMSFTVTVVTLPVQLWNSYTASVYAPVLNLIVIPLMSVLFPAGLCVLAAGGVSGIVEGGLLGWMDAAADGGAADWLSGIAGGGVALLPATVCRGVLWLYELLCSLTLHLPFATRYAGRPALWQIVLYYALLTLITITQGTVLCVITQGTVLCVKKHDIPFFEKRYRDIRILVALLILMQLPGLRIPPHLQITMLDVGQGDGIVICHRDGLKTYRVLIDGGSSTRSLVGQYQILPYLKHEGIGSLDAVFVSHEDLDHCSGVLELMEDMEQGGVRIRALFLPEIGRAKELTADAVSAATAGASAQDTYAELVGKADELGIPVSFLHTGQKLTLGAMSFVCLGPEREGAAVASESVNAHSMILRMRCGAFSALFTGDVEAEGLTALKEVLRAEGEPDVDLLKVSHHGSRLSTDEEFLALTQPEVALISCGRDNRYGHPHEETMELLSAAGAQTFVTSKTGAITVRVSGDGRQFSVETFLPLAK